VWTRGGLTSCTLPDGSSATIPYRLASPPGGYPEASRCTINLGCGSPHVPSVDTVGVSVTYRYTFHTPLGNFVGPLGSVGGGWTFNQSNAMRMEPVL
jgi:hypothetical protein